MLNKEDKIIEAKLYSSHICDYICEREDGTLYVMMRREDDTYREVTIDPTGKTDWIYGEIIK